MNLLVRVVEDSKLPPRAPHRVAGGLYPDRDALESIRERPLTQGVSPL